MNDYSQQNMPMAPVMANSKDVAKLMFTNKENYRGQSGAVKFIIAIAFVALVVILPQIEFTANLLAENAPSVFKYMNDFSTLFMNGGK